MEVKPGYKQTAVGVIPENWCIAPLKDISLQITDGDHTTPNREYSGYYLLSARNILNSRIDLSDVDYVGQSEYLRMKQRCFPERGDILLSCSGTIGRVSVVPDELECVLVRSVALIKPKPNALNSRFIQYWLQGKIAQRNIQSNVNQGAQPNLFIGQIEEIQCPIPPLSEQRAIATALSDMDALLDGLDRLIAKKRAIKQATMQQLLTGQTHLPGFSGEWVVKRLGDLGATYGGITGKSGADFGVGTAKYVPFINVIANTQVDSVALDTVNISATENQNQVAKGDLLFNGSSETPEEVALCSFMAHEIKNLYLNSFCFGFRLKEDTVVDGLFFAYYMRSPIGRDLMKSLAQGSTRYNLSKSALLDTRLALPDKKEQTAIAKVLTDMDAEITALETRRSKTRALKQAMMQELLTGRTRLI